MTFLFWLLVILLVIVILLVLLTLVPPRVEVTYREGQLGVILRIRPLRITLRSADAQKRAAKKEKKERKKQKKLEKQKGKPKKAAKAPQERTVPLSRIALKAAEFYRGRQGIPVDTLHLDVLIGGEDPASAAILFGVSQSALGMIWPILEQNLEVKDRRIRTQLDFMAEKTTLHDAYIVAPIPLFRVLRTLIQTLTWLVAERNRIKQERESSYTRKD
ncbi:MAG: DUF2953 domain-containing protein [Oscillospiraceae bacterium]|nr:DUF2953 domain-containing protein [Oscillospiraceae bacterium]